MRYLRLYDLIPAIMAIALMSVFGYAEAAVKTVTWTKTDSPCVRIVVARGTQKASYKFCRGQTSARLNIPRNSKVSLLTCSDKKARNCKTCMESK